MPRVLNEHRDIIPPGAIYVGRPSKWGNPFRLPPFYANQDPKTKRELRQAVVRQFREFVLAQPEFMEEIRRELKGKDLVCFCAPLACHADVLLEIANAEPVKAGKGE